MKKNRYEALDSWRGICACLVALYHFDVLSHITSSTFFRNSYLFVDFFFVLSGFVIALNYRDRISSGYGIGRFMLLRFGRIYPLHFFLILLFIPIDIAKDGTGSFLWQAITTNVLLLHGLGVNDGNWLNFPSWSISSEFAAYAIFALVVSRVGKSILPWLIPIFIAPIVLWMSPHGMNSTYDFGLVRCLYGFATGVICFSLREMLPVFERPLTKAMDTALEAIAVLAAVIFVSFAAATLPLVLAAPLLFAAVLLIFAREAGALSTLLVWRPFLIIGTLTYSIYMVHALVRAVTRAFMMVVERFFDVQLFRFEVLDAGYPATKVVWLGGSLWLGDLLQMAMLLVTIVLATQTYRYIEEPGRNWSRRLAGRPPIAATAAPALETPP